MTDVPRDVRSDEPAWFGPLVVPPWVWKALDWLVPYLIVTAAYEPNAASGLVDYLESGQYLTVIDTVFRGGALHRDVYFLFGPLTYLGPAAAMLVFGKTLAVLRGYFLAADILTYLVLYLLCRLLIRPRAWAYLASLVIVVQVHHPFWSTRWGGLRFAAAYASIAAWLWYLRARPRGAALLAGTMTALALLHGIDMGLISLAASGILLAADRLLPVRDGRPRPASGAIPYLWGAAAVIAPFLIYLAASGGLGAFVRDLLSIGDRSAWAAPPDWSRRETAKIAFPLFVYGWAAWTVRGEDRDGRVRAALVCGFGLIFYAYAFRSVAGPQLETAMALAILVAFERLGSALSVRPIARMRTACVLILAAWTCYAAVLRPNYFYQGVLNNWRLYQDRKFKEHAHYAGVDERPHRALAERIERLAGSRVPAWQADEIERVVDAIRKHSGDDDAVLAFPDLAFFNFAADRRCVGRFTVPGFAHGVRGGEKELLEAIEAAPPPVVLARTSLSPLARSIGRETELLPAVWEYVSRHYNLAAQTDQVRVYVRRT